MDHIFDKSFNHQKKLNMKKISMTTVVLVLFASAMFAQDTSWQKKMKSSYAAKFGLKAGYNISYVNGTSSGFDPGNNNGFMIAGFYGSAGKSVIGYRSEIVFSRQGYTYADAGTNTDMMNDYIYLPQLTTVNITKYLQLQAGMQIGYLLNSKKTSDGKGADSSLLGFMNRVDYGFSAGIEIYPFKGLIIGGRYNLGLGKMYKTDQVPSTPLPLPFDPATTDLKNASIQIFVGYRF
jgi:hypothetical protein